MRSLWKKLIQQVWSQFLRILDVVNEAISFGSYQDLENGLSRELNEVGQFILKEVFEAIDERLCENPQERRGWVIERRGDVKEILTPLDRYGTVVHTFRIRPPGSIVIWLMSGWVSLRTPEWLHRSKRDW